MRAFHYTPSHERQCSSRDTGAHLEKAVGGKIDAYCHSRLNAQIQVPSPYQHALPLHTCLS